MSTYQSAEVNKLPYQSDQLNELAKALAKAQGQMGTVKEDSNNTFHKSKYSSLAAVIDEIRQSLSSNGISYIQRVCEKHDKYGLETLLIHESGQWISSFMEIDMNVIIEMSKHWNEKSKSMVIGNVDQKLGSTISYYRRYSLLSMLGLASGEKEEDDANSLDRNQNVPNQAQDKKPMPPTPPTIVQRINETQVAWITDTFEVLGKDVEKKVMDRLLIRGCTDLTKIPLDWYKPLQDFIAQLAMEQEAVK